MLRSSSWLNDTALCRTAVYSLTGIAMSPNEMVPLQVDLAIELGQYVRTLMLNPWGEERDPRWSSHRGSDQHTFSTYGRSTRGAMRRRCASSPLRRRDQQL